jgi:hypothetical protein
MVEVARLTVAITLCLARLNKTGAGLLVCGHYYQPLFAL